MSTWRARVADQTSTKAYLRLGSYQDGDKDEVASKFPGDITNQNGVLLTTTGHSYFYAEKDINVGTKGDLSLVTGTFGTDTDCALRVNALGTFTYNPGDSGETTGQSLTVKGSGVTFNAVTASANAKPAAGKALTFYAEDKIVTKSDGMTKFHAGVNVSVTNKTESTYGSQTHQFNLGFVSKFVFGGATAIVPGPNTASVIGLRLAARAKDWKVSVMDFSYNNMKNEIALASQENSGIGSFIVSLFSFYGACVQEKVFTENKQKPLGNETKGASLGFRMARAMQKGVSSRTGVQNTM